MQYQDQKTEPLSLQDWGRFVAEATKILGCWALFGLWVWGLIYVSSTFGFLGFLAAIVFTMLIAVLAVRRRRAARSRQR